MFLDCPRLVTSLSPSLDTYFTLLTGYELQTTPFHTTDYLSLLRFGYYVGITTALIHGNNMPSFWGFDFRFK
jgi:hypothetical protein